MSESLLDQIIEKAEYHGIYIEKDGDLITTRYDKCAAIENAHLMPIIKGQAEVIRMLMESVKFIKNGNRNGRAEIFGLDMIRCPQCISAERAASALTEAERMLKELAKCQI